MLPRPLVGRQARSLAVASRLSLSPVSTWRTTPILLSTSLRRGMAKDGGGPKPRFSNLPNQASTPKPSRSIPNASQNQPPTSPPQPSIQPQRPTVSESAERGFSQDPSAKAPGPDVSNEPQIEKEVPLSSLPDLTQGIPSTLEYETAGATNPSSLTAADDGFAGGGRGKGELPASAYISSSEKRRQKWANWIFGVTAGTVVAGTIYAGRNWDGEDARRHPDVPNGWGLALWWNRATTRTKEVLTYYHEPAFEKLLPDPDPTFERPYTLCISLEDMLVHSEWSREHGWRVAKRPGADYFLRYLSQYYELVLFTTIPFAIAEPLVRKLDPYHFITYPLFREATKYQDGEIVKDLSYINRDLSKVIIIDTDKAHVRAQPENAIVLPKWTGDVNDKELVALIPFLEYIFTMQYPDVRKTLKSFDGHHIPTEFARREAIARAQFEKQLQPGGRKNKQLSGAKGGISSLGSMFGLKPNNMSVMVMPEGEPNPGEEFAKGKMLQDIARERGQRTYEMMDKEIREKGESWLKEEQALQEKAQQEAMESVKSSFAGWFVEPQAKDSKPGAGDEKKP